MAGLYRYSFMPADSSGFDNSKYERIYKKSHPRQRLGLDKQNPSSFVSEEQLQLQISPSCKYA